VLTLPKTTITAPPVETSGLPTRFFNPGELQALMALYTGAKSILEFGVHRGRNAKAAFMNIPGLERYVGVDVLPGYVPSKKAQATEVPEEAGDLLRHEHRFELQVTERGSLDLTTASFGREFDAIFIDGDHSRAVVEHDTALAVGWIKPGGVIIWHDYHDLGTVDVREVLHERFAAGHQLLHVDGTWIVFERF